VTIVKVVAASLVLAAAGALEPWQTALSAARGTAAAWRLRLYGDPAAVAAAVCDAAPLAPPLPGNCAAALFWHAQDDAWTSVCGAPMDAAEVRPERYYRLEIRCRLTAFGRTLPMPLLQATIFR
jgi:hypothetical protein